MDAGVVGAMATLALVAGYCGAGVVNASNASRDKLVALTGITIAAVIGIIVLGLA